MPAPTVAAVVFAQGARWVHRTALPVLLAVPGDILEGALELRLLYLETAAEGYERERRMAAEALARRTDRAVSATWAEATPVAAWAAVGITGGSVLAAVATAFGTGGR